MRRIPFVLSSVLLAACGPSALEENPLGVAGSDTEVTPSGDDDAGGQGDAGDGDSTSSADGADSSDGTSSPASPAFEGCIATAHAGDQVYACEGLTYDVRVPPSCLVAGCGVVLDVHGATMSGPMEDANTRMRALGEQYGFIVIQPSATPAPPSSLWTPADYEPVWQFLQLAVRVFHVDAKRVHVTGFSQGARMTFTFVCQHADRIASAAPVAEAGCSFVGADTPSREVPILHMHGERDALVPYSLVAVPQREAILAGWELGSPQTVASGDDYEHQRYTNARGAVYEFIHHTYSASSFLLRGHCIPGSDDDGGEPGQLFSFACEGESGFDWGTEVMKFFRAHPLP